MIKTYYHVVTEKPMKLGDKIIFDSMHHSGLYNRVYSLIDKVDDIYANPQKYENAKLDHHLKVALRELAMEDIRKKKYPEYPSRLASLYVSNTLKEALEWSNIFKSHGRPTYGIVKLAVTGNEYIGDAWNCFEGTTDKLENYKLAEAYWHSPYNNIGKEPITEIIIDGDIEVIEIIKE